MITSVRENRAYRGPRDKSAPEWTEFGMTIFDLALV
jgi:hypothetical protein